MSKNRGALYMVWPGDPRTEAALQRSIASLQAVHPELPYHVEVMPEGSTLLDKAKMWDISPFDETLFLDADTVVLDRLDFAFGKARRHGIAICICECPWARRFNGLADHGDIVEFNTGVVFFDKRFDIDCQECGHPSVHRLFDHWKTHAKTLDSSLFFMGADGATLMRLNDQASFALAVETTWFNPSVLPMNWNYRPRWQKSIFGPVKIWHDYDDVRPQLLAWNAEQRESNAILQCARTA